MVKIMENPIIQNWWFGGFPTIFGSAPIQIGIDLCQAIAPPTWYLYEWLGGDAKTIQDPFREMPTPVVVPTHFLGLD